MRGSSNTIIITSIRIWALLCFVSLQSQLPRASLELSLNCGGPAFNDTITTIRWLSDEPYVVSNYGGRTAEVLDPAALTDESFRTLRYFPPAASSSSGNKKKKNSKYCYTLPDLISSNLYLIRVGFFYGNYDGHNRPPSFALLLNYDVWIPIVNTTSNEPLTYETTYVSSNNVAYVCLATNASSNSSTPFISSLQLSLLENDMYNRYNELGTTPPVGLFSGYALHLFRRINYGAATNASIRYPADPYDRIWEANTTRPAESLSATNISTSNDWNKPPAEVMATAIAGTGADGVLEVEVDGSLQSSGGYYVAMHFAELSGVSRNITVDTLAGRLIQYPIPLNGRGVAARVHLDQIITGIPSPFTVDLSGVNGSFLNALEILTWSPQVLRSTATAPADVQALENLQEAFNLTSLGEGDPCVPHGYGWSWITCNNNNDNLRIIEINLTNFGLQGEIFQFLTNLTKLQNIYLADNELNGSIPDLHSLQDLQLLDLRNNQFSGQISSSLAQLPQLKEIYLDGNQGLCGSIPSLFQQKDINVTYSMNTSLCDVGMSCACPEMSTSSRHSSTTKYVVIVSALAAFYVVSIVATLLFCGFQRRKVEEKIKSNLYATLVKDTEEIFSIQYLKYEEIRDATNEFANKIAEGGFGDVYRGTLKNGQDVAIKLLTDTSGQGIKEFNSEVAILSKVHHKNLVSLIGYSMEKSYALVYEYIPRGNLGDNLYGDTSKDETLPWATRLCLAIDTALGLEYLHVGCEPSIIHRDVKSSNILLTDKMQAKVADFGFSRLRGIDSTKSHISTQHVVGTVGYLDPEYHYTSQFTDKSDVYSFGVVLFELICGRPPIDSFTVPAHIISWVMPSITNDQIEDIIDPKLIGGYKLESIKMVVDIAWKCVRSDRISRPTISEVIQRLREAEKLENGSSKTHKQDISSIKMISNNSNASYEANIEIEAQMVNLAR